MWAARSAATFGIVLRSRLLDRLSPFLRSQCHKLSELQIVPAQKRSDDRPISELPHCFENPVSSKKMGPAKCRALFLPLRLRKPERCEGATSRGWGPEANRRRAAFE